jgi:undecaprenyl-diphosphatase
VARIIEGGAAKRDMVRKRLLQAARWLRAGDAPWVPLPPAWLAGLAVLATLAFAALAVAVVAGATARWDDRIELGVHAHAAPDLGAAMRGLTDLGYIPTITAIVVGADLALLRVRQRLAAAALTALMLGEGAWDDLLKLAAHRPRPDLFPHAPARGWSFPSGHAFATFCLAALLLYLAWRGLPRPLRFPLLALSAVVVFGVGLSRVYLGVHYPSDVAGGWLAGTAWLAAAGAWVRRRVVTTPSPRRRGRSPGR